MGRISGFYAVTLGHSTPWLITHRHKLTEGTLKITPVVHPKGESNISAGEKLPNCKFVILKPDGIIFTDSISRDSLAGMDFLCGEGEKTGPVVGLFLNHDDAMACSRCKEELKNLDSRWQNETTKVLQRIGNNHPIFIIPNPLEWGLSEEDLQIPAE